MKRINNRARRFKAIYRESWRLGNQKEAFVKTLLESWGFYVKNIGIGVMREEYVRQVVSLPDFAVYIPGDKDIVAYVEVTGGRNVEIGENLWVCASKYDKYFSLARDRPVYFIYIGFKDGKMNFIRYCNYNTLKKYADNIKTVKIRGIIEHYIVTPFSAWNKIKYLYNELRGLIG